MFAIFDCYILLFCEASPFPNCIGISEIGTFDKWRGFDLLENLFGVSESNCYGCCLHQPLLIQDKLLVRYFFRKVSLNNA